MHDAPMTAFTSSPGALRLFVVSIVARLPLAMLTIGMLVHVESATGSFAAAGLASGTLAVAQGIGGPLLGRLVDRRGQSAVLVVSALVAGLALAGVAALPADPPLVALLSLSAVLGAATPPVSACLRALLPVVVRTPGPCAARTRSTPPPSSSRGSPARRSCSSSAPCGRPAPRS